MDTAKSTTTEPKSFQISQATQRAVNAHSRDLPPRQYVRAEGLPAEVPDTYAEADKLWRKFSPLLRNPWLDPEDRKRIKEIGKRCHTLQQGLATILASPSDGAEERYAAICTWEARRQTENTALKAALAAHFDGEPIVCTRQQSLVVETYLVTDGIDKVLALKQALAEFTIKWNELFPLHSPERRAEERKAGLHSNPSPEQSNRIAEEAALTTNPHFQQLCLNARSELSTFWDSRVKPAELALLDSALQFVKGCKESSIAAEKEFFAWAEVEYEPTKVSKRFDSVLADLQHHRDLVAKGSGHSSPTQSVLQTVLAVPVLDDVEWWANGCPVPVQDTPTAE